MKFKDIARTLAAWAPPSLAESYDNVGLIVGLPNTECTGILINLDVTEALLDEAIAKGANLILTHHPIWFGARKRLNGEDYVSRIIIKAIKNDIGLLACHTNLDNVQDGVNRRIGEVMGANKMQILSPKGKMKEVGSGMIGYLPAPMAKRDFLQHVKDKFRCGGIRYADFPGETIHKVAWCGGAGSFLIGHALRAGADAFVTGDITYHKYFDNENRLLLMDIGHYESEQYTSQLLHHYISEKFVSFAVHLSEIETNPVNYF
ncbi:UNVERIFIED_CONTAM: hypothetical protein GTU68_057425 [Idotea baltica]|nr:hypothetical protein [Idotea baltica]